MGRPGGLLLLPLLLAAPGAAGAGPCEAQESCEACVLSHPRCAWCQDPDFPGGGQAEPPRCAPREVLEGAGCPPEAVVEPRGHLKVLRDEELGPGGARGGPVQLRPQSIQLLLRPGETRSFGLRFRRAPGPPVDLYYLMDLSYSMRDDLERLRRLGRGLPVALGNLTSSLRIGFGSFVDKPVLPYVSTVASRLRSPCPAPREPCDPPAAFRHVLALTADADEFARQVARQRISGNLDSPEGGFDAIMQVALCQDRVGWGRGSRLLLVATDDTFHSAGDGRLGGLVLPPDPRCRLDAHGLYSDSHLYDYPSVGHLAQVLADADIQPIFAVTRPTLPVYQELSRLIPRSVVRELREDSSNVVQLIADAYETLLSTVELQHSPLPPGISLSYESHCGGPPTPPRPHGGLCTGVGVDQEVSFTVRVRAAACLGSRHRVGLRARGFAAELSLELGTVCGCSCAPPRPRAPLCHGGSLRCGVCRCPEGRWGRRCECVGGCCSPHGTGPPNGTEPPHGTGSRVGCERHEGLLCGGPQRGECVCGRCRCREGFVGSGCGCPRDRGSCLRDGRECSGHGRCVCGSCRCRPGYVGPLCAHCPACPTPCQRLRDCAHCAAWGPLRGNCSRVCGRVTARRAPTLPADTRGWCREEAGDGRVLLFLIEGAGGEEEEEEEGRAVTLTVWAEEAWTPGLVAAGLVAAGFVAAGLVALGLLRLCLELRDRRDRQRGRVATPPHAPAAGGSLHTPRLAGGGQRRDPPVSPFQSVATTLNPGHLTG